MRQASASIFAITALSLFTGGETRSQTQTPITLPQVVVTSRLPVDGAQVALQAADTTVITRENIEALKPSSTVDLLRNVPGMHIDQPGGRGGVSSVYIRGADPNFTLVMIDGVRVNDPTNSRGGSFNFNLLDPGSIERIEVVRNPLSAIYGSDAMAGVINIITRGGDSRRATVQAEGGRLGYGRVWSEIATPVHNGSFALSGAYVDDGTPIEGSSYRGSDFNLNLRFAPAINTTASLTSHYVRSQSSVFPDDSGGPRFAVLRDVDRRNTELWTAGGEVRHEIDKSVSVTARASHYQIGEVFASPGVAPGLRDPFGIVPNSSDSQFNRDTFSAFGQFSPNSLLSFTAGAEAVLERGRSESVLLFGTVPLPGRFTLSRDIYASFGEARLALPFGLTLEAAVRVDQPDAFDSAVSPRARASQVFDATGTTLFASWGKGFKLPSFFALANPIVGNPNLVPETSESVQAGIEQKLPVLPASLRATVFHSDYYNLIDFVEGPPPRLENLAQVVAKGYELGADFSPSPSFRTGVHVTFTDTEIVGSDQRLRNRPRWRAGGYVQWAPYRDLTVAVNGSYVGSVFDSSIPTGDVVLDPYFRVDLTVTWAVMPSFDISLTLQNLLNERYEEAVGFPASGVRPRLIARATF